MRRAHRRESWDRDANAAWSPAKSVGLERRGAFTIIEAAIYVVLTILIGAPIFSMMLRSARYTAELDSTAKVQERNRSSLYRVEHELREAIASTVTIMSSGAKIRFVVATDFDGVAVIQGDTLEFELRLVGDESSNSADDNGNGLVDEGELVFRNVTSSTENVICQGIDLSRSGFRAVGSGLLVDLVNIGQIPTRAETIDAVGAVTVFPMNH